MKVTIEISLYPLQEKYKKPIKAFIKSLHTHKEINVHTTAMSTYITGRYDDAMHILTKRLKTVYKEIPKSATVIKVIPMELDVNQGFMKF